MGRERNIKGSENKKKLMMNIEQEQNVAKTSRENEELMKKGKLNCCFMWEFKEL